jgi:ABC-type antimicrobial peptide transport system permease subunit
LLHSGKCSYVIGVVTNANRMRVLETASMNYFLPARSGTTLVVRMDPERWAHISARLRQEFKTILPGAEPLGVRRMTESIDRELRPWRLGASLFVAFGLLALVVAAIGVYSVTAYAVSQRTHEMGIRIALGAQFSDVMRLVIGEGVGVVAVGAALGVAASIALGKLVATLLYGVTPRDPAVMGVAAGILLFVGVAAALTPAWRAARVDPVVALRTD